MKRYFAIIANVLAIFTGLLGLGTPYITDAVVAMGLGRILDNALLQPLFIGLVIIAIWFLFKKARETLTFLPLILEFVFGVIGFLFIFPFKNLFIGYIALLGILYVILWPYISKKLLKKKIVKIKA